MCGSLSDRHESTQGKLRTLTADSRPSKEIQHVCCSVDQFVLFVLYSQLAFSEQWRSVFVVQDSILRTESLTSSVRRPSHQFDSCPQNLQFQSLKKGRETFPKLHTLHLNFVHLASTTVGEQGRIQCLVSSPDPVQVGKTSTWKNQTWKIICGRLSCW